MNVTATRTNGAQPFAHDGLAFGCDYNPEQWAPEVWPTDIALMKEAGVDLVAINIFGWAQLEPRPGEYDFTALDAIVGLLHAGGIRINLGTGTSTPPPWLTMNHPEVLPVVEDGTTRYPGGRQAWCPSSPVYRTAALALVEKVAERYGAHPAVALWHVSNELGCHNALCHDEESARSFRRWLEAKYSTIEALNVAWGTSVWSQRYSDWSEIRTPLLTLSSRNPSQALDFHRFSSDELLDYYRSEVEVLRRHSDVAITTNFMVTAHIRNLDYWSWAPEMDIVANDHYLDHRLGDPRTELSFAADLTRGLAGGDRWMLMESATGAVNWQPLNFSKAPGQLTRNSLSHVARGAEAVCFFQWRASLQGSEKFHSAMLPHAGTDTLVWREVVQLGSTMQKLAEIVGTRVVADAALVFSWEAWWAADGESRPSHSVNYLQQVHAHYGALHELGLTVDIVAPDADLSGYPLVVAPMLHMVSDGEAANLTDYIAGGGHALITFYSGIVDKEDRVRAGGYPGAFREALGIVVEEFVPVTPGQQLTLDTGATATLWSERLTLTAAQAIARFTDGAVPGVPAITTNAHGAGTAWYLATTLEKMALRELLARVVGEAGILQRPDFAAHVAKTGETAVEIIRRSSADRSFLFVLNHGEHDFVLSASGTELLTGESVAGSLLVAAGAVCVIREDIAS